MQPTGKNDATERNAMEEPSMDKHARIMNILVAEDHPTNQMIVKHHLERYNHTVSIASNGYEVIEKCKEQRFDLILMDIQMPEMDGIEATQRIRQMSSPNQNTPVVAVTASAEKSIRGACMAAGMNDVVAKPLLFSQLLETLNKWQTVSVSNEDIEQAASEPVEIEQGKEAPIDYSTLFERLDGDRDFAKMLLDGFCTQTDTMLREMKAALEQDNLDAVRQGAHTIKGGALNIVAPDLQEAAKSLEESAKQHTDDAWPLFANIESEYNRLKTYLDETLD